MQRWGVQGELKPPNFYDTSFLPLCSGLSEGEVETNGFIEPNSGRRPQLDDDRRVVFGAQNCHDMSVDLHGRRKPIGRVIGAPKANRIADRQVAPGHGVNLAFESHIAQRTIRDPTRVGNRANPASPESAANPGGASWSRIIRRTGAKPRPRTHHPDDHLALRWGRRPSQDQGPPPGARQRRRPLYNGSAQQETRRWPRTRP